MILEKNKIHIISTGGTIEKIYDEKKGLLGNKGTVIEDIIASKLRLPFSELEFHELMAKDSLDFDDFDRQKILDFVLKLSFSLNPVILLHGTDTLQKTVAFFEEKIEEIKRPLIFTGAMKPVGFFDSDAIQNITEALTLARVLSPGLYVSFHSQLIQGSRFKKNYDLGTFEKEPLRVSPFNRYSENLEIFS